MSIESPTQTEIPTPTEVVQEQATEESAAVPESPADQEEAAPEPFARIKYNDTEYIFNDDYELVDSEIVKPHLERHVEREKTRLRTELESEFQQATKDWESTQLNRTLAGHMGTVLQKLQDGDADGFEKALGRVEALVQPYEQVFQDNLKRDGMRTASLSLMGELMDSISDRRTRDQFEDWLRTGQRSWKETFDKYGKVREEVIEKKAYERGLKDGREAREASIKAEERGKPGAGPDATPAKSGSSKAIQSVADADRRYGLPDSDPEHLTHAEYKAYREANGIR